MVSYMSIVTLKRKTDVKYKNKISGKGPGGKWITQGPHGYTTFGSSGFSLNGSHRNTGRIGKTYEMSKSGTPYRGINPIGNGGTLGQYYSSNNILNNTDSKIIINGSQREYIKPSGLSMSEMINNKFKWIKSGTYPNYWVQPVYNNYQSDSKSQGLYLHNKKIRSMNITDVNNKEKYVNNIKIGGSTNCNLTTTRHSFNSMFSGGLYTKTINQPLTSGERTLRIQHSCAFQTQEQKPFPPPVQTGTGILTGGIKVGNNGAHCNIGPIKLMP